MKKVVSLLIAAVMLVGLAGCGIKSKNSETNKISAYSDGTMFDYSDRIVEHKNTLTLLKNAKNDEEAQNLLIDAGLLDDDHELSKDFTKKEMIELLEYLIEKLVEMDERW